MLHGKQRYMFAKGTKKLASFFGLDYSTMQIRGVKFEASIIVYGKYHIHCEKINCAGHVADLIVCERHRLY